MRGDEAWAWAWIQVFDDDARGDPLVEDILIEELPDPAELDDYDLEEWIGALDVTSVNPIVAEHPTLRKKFGGWVRDLVREWNERCIPGREEIKDERVEKFLSSI